MGGARSGELPVQDRLFHLPWASFPASQNLPDTGFPVYKRRGDPSCLPGRCLGGWGAPWLLP